MMLSSQYPYIFTSPIVSVQQEFSYDNEKGVTYREGSGEHAIWAARVPFIPAMLSDDLTRFGTQRISLIQERQFRFIYDLVRAREHLATFTLRFISTPNPVIGQPNLIDIVFFGKAYSKREGGAQVFAEELWEKFVSNFPMEDPFGYPLLAIDSEKEFFSYYEPISFSQITERQLMEIRKYEDMPLRGTTPLGRVERKGDYIAHPFVPSQNFNPMGRFFMALANQPQKCFVDISIRPTKMFDQEIFNVSFMIGQFKKTATEDDDVTEEYIRKRSQIGVFVYESMMLEREQLMMIRVHLVGEDSAPKGLAEALGSEMMGNAASRYPTRWTAAQPATEDETRIALKNIRYFEHDFWGLSLASPPLRRLRYLATATEAYGAFRLPVPPESGYMPGVLVRNEPFIVPMDELELREQARQNYDDVEAQSQQAQQEAKISLGRIYHRGNETPQDLAIAIRSLTRHALISGSTGSGKSTTIKHILAQLWEQHRIPFLVLYPLDKPDYRELRGFPGLNEHLLIYTIGDETTVPFRFNPFEVPEGILIKTHLSRLMDVFESAFSLQDPLPMVYRDALRKIYRDAGWNLLLDRGSKTRDYPTMADFYNAIKDITEGLNYGREVQDNVKQASVIRIGDLLENAGYAINTKRSPDFNILMNQPTIMELGRIGSTDDIALIMGFLLIRLAEEIEQNPRPAEHPHITVVEEAHRLMAEQGTSNDAKGNTRKGAGENFGNLLAEVRGYGEGIIIAEQIPTLLIKGAIGNTFIKIMHWLEDAPSFELFANITNLDQKQKEYARTLKPGFAIIRSVYGKPVHIKVPEFGDQPGFFADAARKISDQDIRQMMQGQQQKFHIQQSEPIAWTPSMATQKTSTKAAVDSHWALYSPMQTCLYCPGRETNRCMYKTIVTAQIISKPKVCEPIDQQLMAALSADEVSMVSKFVLSTLGLLKSRFPSLDQAQLSGWVYCYLAHKISELPQTNETEAKVLARGKKVLEHFESFIPT